MPNDATYVVLKPLVQHTICLIQHEILHSSEGERAIAYEIKYAPRCADHDLYTFANNASLLCLVDPSKHGDAFDGIEGGESVIRLKSELPRRRDDERARRAFSRRTARRGGEEAREGGDAKGQRLPAARLRDTHDVPPRERGRPGASLDGSRFFESGECASEGIRDGERVEGRDGDERGCAGREVHGDVVGFEVGFGFGG
jgi:hypothetical protein